MWSAWSLEKVRIINASFQIWGCVMSLILLVCLIVARRCKTKPEKLYLAIISLNMAVMAFDFVALCFREKKGIVADIGVRASNFLSFASGAVLAAVFLKFVIAYLEQKFGRNVRIVYKDIATGMMIVMLAMLIVNLFRPFIYQINADNIYSRMELYPFVMLPIFINLAATSKLIAYYRKDLDRWEKIPFMIYVIAPVVGLVGSALTYGIVFAHIGSTGAIIIMFVFLQMEQSKRMIKQETELMQSKLDIIMSQIRPHFLYNTLDTLSALSQKDGMVASEAIDDFSIYLRGNFRDLDRRLPIDFEKELEQIRIYIKLEKLRFRDDLNMTYDIETTDFQVPAISIQPMVENAVLHGLMGKDSVCTIELVTRDKGDYVEITISDDGAGFDTTKGIPDDGRKHIGIANVTYRMEEMMHGTVKVESIIGMGTKVTIQIPKRKYS